MLRHAFATPRLAAQVTGTVVFVVAAALYIGYGWPSGDDSLAFKLLVCLIEPALFGTFAAAIAWALGQPPEDAES